MKYTILFSLLLIFNFGCFNNIQAKETSPDIGKWITDNNGLPCFKYTGVLPFTGIMPDGNETKNPDDPWFILGNYRFTLFPHVSGEYEMISGEREWGRLNQGREPNSGSNSSSITILDKNGNTEESILLTGMESVATDPLKCERYFGCGFATYIYHIDGLLVKRTLSVLPSEDVRSGISAFLLNVKIENMSKREISLIYNESILANYTSIQYQRNEFKPITFTNNFVTHENGKMVIAKIAGASSDPLMITSKNEMSMYDSYPPELFMKIFGEGTVDCNGNNIQATDKKNLKPGEEAVVSMVIGYAFDSSSSKIEKMALSLKSQAKSCNEKTGISSPFGSQWRKVIPDFASEKEADLRQELQWHAYSLEAMATYSQFYDETKIPQGTIYDYYWGQHASARDNFQHALPLIYYNHNLAKSVMRYMAKRTTPSGEIKLIEFGNGYADGLVYNASDQQLFFFLLISEYLRVTKDYDFLKEQIKFFPVNGGREATMLDVVQQCFHYLRYNVARGAHGLVRLLNSDWNDNVFVAKRAAYNNVVNTGESHMNTTMALSILQNMISLLKEYADDNSSEQTAKIVNSMVSYRKELYNDFMKDLGDRLFSRRMYFDGKAIGDDNMFLEPQGYMLQIAEIPVARKQALYEEMKKRLYEGEKLGARQQQTPEFEAPGLENGSRENGGFWYSLNGPVIVGVNTFNKDEAYRLFKKMTFKNYAHQFPKYWTSYWSASDNIESSLMGPQEGLPDQSFDYNVIPIFCAHPHAYILYCYYILNDTTLNTNQ